MLKSLALFLSILAGINIAHLNHLKIKLGKPLFKGSFIMLFIRGIKYNCLV